MKSIFKTPLTVLAILAILALLSILSLPSFAGPGAHGPNGEHLDTPNAAGAIGAASPRLETKTEQFELVATLAGGELSIMIDRFETNEPLLNAMVEVESGGLKAKARFHADHGDYAVDDQAMLKLLGKPGTHALVITVIAGKESDLLDGTLNVLTAMAEGVAHGHGPGHGQDGEHADEHADEHGHGWGSSVVWLGGGVLALGLLVAFVLRKRSGGLAFKNLNGDAA